MSTDAILAIAFFAFLSVCAICLAAVRIFGKEEQPSSHEEEFMGWPTWMTETTTKKEPNS
jgi:hypothetical protein